jgi:hypothetical protein
MINIHGIREIRKPHHMNTRAYHEHLEAVKHATTQRLKREVERMKTETMKGKGK